MNKRGFTYLELLAVLAILVIVITLVNDNLVQGLKTWVVGNKLSEVRQFLRYDMQNLCNNIRFAEEVNFIVDELKSPIIDEISLINDGVSKIEIISPSGYTVIYEINNEDELLSNSNSMGGPIAEITIRRVNIYSFGSLYEVTMESKNLGFETVPSLYLKQLVFSPNVKS